MIQMDASKTLRTSSIEWIPQPSIMRILACIAIIVLHTVFAANEYFVNEILPSQNLISRIVENNMMWAVPVFLMVTGALHLDRRKFLPLKKLYKKYILRIMAALAVFSVIFRLFDMFMDGEAFSADGICKAFYEMLTSTGWGHLWYLYLLIGLYILMPFYKTISENCDNIELTYLLSVYFVFLSLIPLAESFGIKIGFYISESLVYPLYLFLGHMIHEKRIYASKKLGEYFAVISVLLITILTLLKYSSDIGVTSLLYGYQSPFVIIQSIGAFMIIDNSDINMNSSRRRIIKTLDGMTFGIYLTHMVFIRLLFRYINFNPFNYCAPLALPACVVCIFVISCFTVVLLKRIPVIGRVL